MNIVITTREAFSDAEYLPLFDGDCIISIASPGFSHPRPKAKVPRLDVQFHDVTEEVMDGEKLWRVMEDEHAEMIVQFITEQVTVNNCDRLIIHCDAGISRSPGVGIGLARFFNFDLTENDLRDRFPHFNVVVAGKIWKECEKRGYEPRFDQRGI